MVPDFPPRFLGVTSCNNPTVGTRLQCHQFLGLPSFNRFGKSLSLREGGHELFQWLHPRNST